jgi:hypothetical protein
MDGVDVPLASFTAASPIPLEAPEMTMVLLARALYSESLTEMCDIARASHPPEIYVDSREFLEQQPLRDATVDYFV